jgi:atypical dual specificity phosphatase
VNNPSLQLEGFGIAFGDRIVLASIDLSIDRRGATVIVGPGGAGKSTLLRTLVGLNDAQPSLRTWGTVRIDGKEAHMAKRRRNPPTATQAAQRRLALVVQDARFLTSSIRENLASGLPARGSYTQTEQEVILRKLLTENGLSELCDVLDNDVITLPLGQQRRLAIVRASASDPLILCIDEGSADLDEEESKKLLSLLRQQATKRAILFVTHNQRHARELGGTTVLVAGGRIVAEQVTAEFFKKPINEAAERFVRTGGCNLPSPNASADELGDSVAPLPLPAEAKQTTSRFAGPRGFYWLKPQKIAGVPRPGIIADLEDDLDALARLGITTLVTLEEDVTVPPETLRQFGIQPLLFPIVDMQPPSLGMATELCTEVARLVANNEKVAIHCRAGLGRTGTVLACLLVWEGKPALDSLEIVRGINPRFIQSSEQVAFLGTFESWLRDSAAAARH